MYKFRDVSQATYNASNKTELQTYFTSATGVAQSVPSAIATTLAALFGHKIHIKIRLLGTQSVCLLMFVITIALVKVNTDTCEYYGILP